MSDERLKFLGRRAELELKRANLNLRIESLVSGIREELDPLKDPADLRTDQIAAQALDLAEARDRYLETQADLKKIQEILGR